MGARERRLQRIDNDDRADARDEIEGRADRKAMAREAGFGRFSVVSILSGMLVAFGAFAFLGAVAAGIVRGTVGNDLTVLDWKELSIGAGITAAVILFFSYLLGGYVAGRMARRSGMAHGLLVVVISVVVAFVAAGVTKIFDDSADDTLITNLRSLGVPTAATEWQQIASVAAGVALLAMLIGGLLGGALGERWHTKLSRRALDPEIGTAADERRRAESDLRAAEERREEARQRYATLNSEREIDLRPHEPAPMAEAPVAETHVAETHVAETHVGEAPVQRDPREMPRR